MKFELELVIGETKYKILEDAETHQEFIEKASFFSAIPKSGPNGETDLKLVHRVAQGKYDYYSIISEKAQMEFKLGQSQQKPGALFAKGWEKLYTQDQNQGYQQESVQAPQYERPQVPQMQQAPVAPQPQVPQMQTTGVNHSPPVTSQPVQPAMPAPPPSQTQNQALATDVLKKFGI